MGLKDEKKEAMRMVKELHKVLSNDKIGVIGGTVNPRNKSSYVLVRDTDKCIFGEKAFCNLHRLPAVPAIEVIECNIPFQGGPQFIEKRGSDICLATGLAITNPVVRFLMFDIPLETLNKVSFADVRGKPRWPIATWLEKGTSPQKHLEPLEEFRVDPHRPKWYLEMTSVAEKCRYFARTKDGSFTELTDKKSLISSHLSSYASGVEWELDFAILSLVKNPMATNERMLILGGSHWIGTWATQALINLVRKIPELNINVEGTIDSMSWLWKVVSQEDLSEFIAIVRVTDSYLRTGRTVYPYISGVFSLPP